MSLTHQEIIFGLIRLRGSLSDSSDVLPFLDAAIERLTEMSDVIKVGSYQNEEYNEDDAILDENECPHCGSVRDDRGRCACGHNGRAAIVGDRVKLRQAANFVLKGRPLLAGTVGTVVAVDPIASAYPCLVEFTLDGEIVRYWPYYTQIEVIHD
jgi:hypothetical protein